jgi:NADPH-dependent 2,4-dienoyl-CoA reductase/sulfur reductase-like enzyme
LTTQSKTPGTQHIVIIGNGIAGITAARHIRKLSDHAITVISSESEYFYSRTALMYIYMGHMRFKDTLPYEHWFWKKNKISLIHDQVIGINDVHKSISTISGKTILYDKLILATGSSSNTLDIPGKDLDGVTALYSIQDLEYIESKSAHIRRAVIVGGGLIGVELAEMFHSRGIAVTFLVREKSFSAIVLPSEESDMINRHIREHGIDLRLSTELNSIIGDENGRVKSVKTSNGEEIECQFAALSIGVHPNVNWLRNTPLAIEKGIVVDPYLKTNIDGIYAIGDCTELKYPPPGRKSIEPFWYTGKKMGEYVAQTICERPTLYTPGHWYNSAKFFEIENQVYGDIRPLLSEDLTTLFWQHTDGKKSIRINYNNSGVVGFNLMGIRFRQDVCEKWLNLHSGIEDVLANLELALFDQEFSRNYAHNVREAYKQKKGKSIIPVTNRSYNQVFSFLRKNQTPSL